MAKRIGAEVQRLRLARNMTAVQLAERTTELGYPMNRIAIAKIENGHRGAKIDLSEVIVFAAALGVPPVQLIYPGVPGETADVLPGVATTSWDALRWMTGEAGPAVSPAQAAELDWRSDTESLNLIREERVLWSMLDNDERLLTSVGGKLDAETLKTLAESRESALRMIGRNRQAQRDRGMTCLPPRAGFESVDEMDV
jgi:transcriptional regulator with XRE-family HTH domain